MRIDTLKKRLLREDRLPFLILDLVNIRYLTGFEGSSALLIVSV